MSDISPITANLKLKANLTKPVEDIAAIAKDTHKGVGKVIYALCGPMMERRVGQAKRIAAQADKDCLDILAGRKVFDAHTGMTVPIKEVSSVETLCTELEYADADCKAKRLTAAIMKSAAEIKQIPAEEISDEPLDQTFFNHWRAEAELIDDEELRSWWSHLLAEEVRAPRSISPRTLDVAKNLSKREAESFVKIAPGIVNNAVIINDVGYPIFGDYDDILSLQDARLVSAQRSSATYNSEAENQEKNKITVIPFLESKCALAFEKDKISFQFHALTQAGREIYKIAQKVLEIDQIQKIAEEISSQNAEAIANIFRVREIVKKASGDVYYHMLWDPIWTNRTGQPV